MGQIDRAATFRGHMTNQAVGVSKSGHTQLEADFTAIEKFDEETGQWIDWSKYDEAEIHGYLFLMSKEQEWYKTANQVMKAFGWSGTSWSELDDADYSNIIVQFRVVMDTYDNKTRPKVAWIDHADADPSRTAQKMDRSELKALDAKCANAFKKLAGGTKPKTVPAGKPAAPKVKSDPTPAVQSSVPVPSGKTTVGYEKRKPGRPKTTKPTTPKTSSPAKAEDVPEIEVPAAILTDDEAWTQVEAKIPDGTSRTLVEEIWLKTVEDLGGPDAVEKEQVWANVRDIVIEQMCE